MKYIKGIILENFQSHKYTELEFGPELNVIIGPSDSGKSAIIRALKWVMYNEPSGDFFIREGEKECKVTLSLSDGTILQRYRTRSKNGYKLIDSNGNENIFEGIGLSVPQEVIDITGIRKIKLDTDSENAINLGEQLEGAFLLTEKASTRANAIGRLVGVDIVDDALRDVLRDVRALNQLRKQKEEALQTTNDKLSEFDYIDDIKRSHLRASSIMGKIHNINLRAEKLEQMSKNLKSLSGDISKNEDVLNGLNKLDEVESDLTKIESKLDRLVIYSKLYDLYNETKVHKDRIDNILDRISNFVKASPMISDIELKIYHQINLQRINASAQNTKKEAERIKVLLRKLDKLDYTSNLINSAEIKSIKYVKLNSMREKRISTQKSKERGIMYIGELKPLLDSKNVLVELENKALLLKDLNIKKEKYNSIRNDIIESDGTISKNDSTLKVILDKYKNLLQKIEKCPYCLGDIDENTIEHIVTHHLGG